MQNTQARVALIVIMAIPLLLVAYFYLFTEPVYEGVPFQYDIQNGDTVYHEVPIFSLVNQHGDTISREDVKGKILFIDFFSTKTSTYDTRIVSGNREIALRTVLHGNLKRVHEKINWDKNPDILFLSINTGDSSSEIEAYMKKDGWPENNWWVLQGNPEDIYRLGQGAFHLDEFKNKAPGHEPFTSNYVTLADKEGKVRNYYVATNLQQERDMLQDYVALLRFDYPEETKAIRNR
ncbi:MAG: hypothetical protein AAFY71_14925 [Bacteroidota bacterium]